MVQFKSVKTSKFIAVLVVALTAITATPTNAAAIRVLSSFEDTTLKPELSNVFSPVVSTDARHLYAGTYSGALISQFDLDASGKATYNNTLDLANQSSELNRALNLQFTASGTHLYVAGITKIARLSRNAVTGALTLVAELSVTTDQTITGMTLSQDNRHLYVATSGVELEEPNLRSALHRYNVSPADGALTLADSLSATVNPYDKLTMSSDKKGFLGRIDGADRISRDPATGVLTLLASSVARGILLPSSDGRSLYTSDGSGITAYAIDPDSDALTELQEFTTTTEPTTGQLGFIEVLRFNQNETRLLATGDLLVNGRTSIGALTSFVRDPQTGLLTFEEPGPVRARSLALHPFEDRFYALRPSFEPLMMLGPVPLSLHQLALNPSPLEASVISAVLPTSRVQTNSSTSTDPVTAFATVLNTGTVAATNCSAVLARASTAGIALTSVVTDPITNAPIAGTEGAFGVPAGGATSLLFSIRAEGTDNGLNEATELLDLRFSCDNALISEQVAGVTTFGFAVSDSNLPDLPTSVATITTPGVVELPSQGGSLFAVSTINIGGSALIRAEPALELGGRISGVAGVTGLPDLTLTICETNPDTGVCLAEPAPVVDRTIATDEIVTFNVYAAAGSEDVAFNPERNRLHVLFREGADGAVRGGSSVAVKTLLTEND